MKMLSHHLSVAALALWALPAARAQSIDVNKADMIVGIAAGNFEGTRDYKVWQTYNASRSVALRGPNLTDAAEFAEWELILSLHADIPFPELPATLPDDPTFGKYFTGTQIALLAPDDVRNLPANDSSIRPDYDLCMGIHLVVAVDDDADIEATEDGSCEGFVSDACLEEIRGKTCNLSGGMPEACREEDNVLATSLEFDTTVRSRPKRSFAFRISESGDIHDKGNTTVYDEAKQKVYFVYTGLVPSGLNDPDARVHVALTCLRVNDIVGEIQDPEDDEGAAALTTVAKWPAFGVAAMAILLTLV